MKKILYATTAIAAVSAISAANAQESAMMSAAGNDLSIGGYYEFGYASRSDDHGGEENGADTFTYGESELYIDFETTSDSGLTYGVQLDLEVVNGSQHKVDGGDPNNTDEASIYVSGNFGTINLGHDDYASSLYNIWAPTHDGSISQDDSINGIRYGEGAGLRVVGDATDNVTVQARADFLAGGNNRDEIEDGKDPNGFILLSDIPGVTTRDDVIARVRATDPAAGLSGAEATAATAAAQRAAEAIADAVLTEVDITPDDTDNGTTLVLRGLQHDHGLAYTASLTQSNDNAKISYHSPNLGGLSFGGSFADDDASDNTPTSLGASFTGSVDKIPFVGGGFSYKLAGWQFGNGADGIKETSTTHYGVNLGIGDLTLTAAQLKGDISTTTEDEVETLELGIGYAVHDALSVGFSTADASNDDSGEEGTFQSVSVSYTIAPGLNTTAAYNQYEVERNEHLIANSGSELVWQVEFAF